MPKQILTLNDFSGGINNLKDPRDIKLNELSIGQNIMFDLQGVIRSMGSRVDHTETNLKSHACSLSAGFGLYYFEGDRGPVSSVTASTIQFNNGAGSNVIHQNDPTDDVYQAFNAGDVIEVSGSTSNDGLYEVLYRDSSVGWSGIIVDRDLTTEAAGSSVTIKKHSVGEKYIALSDADNGVIDIWTQSSDSWSPSEITIASGSNLQSAIKAVYHFVDNVLRIADANFGNSSKVKWYGFIERIHFADEDGNSANSSDVFLGFYENDNDLAPPTAGDKVASVSYTGLSGDGFNIYPQESSDGGEWEAKIWEFAETFIYDDGQESLLKVMSTTWDNSAGIDNRKLTLAVMAKKSYGNRVSGGRIYVREYQSDKSWSLLVDINLSDGVRVSFNSTYTTWTDAGSGQFNVQNMDSIGIQIDSFETLNGYSHDVPYNSLGGTSESYKCSVIANRRTFIANVRIKERGTAKTVYGDRIMYSEVNKFDTFPPSNFIDVIKGDAEEYVAIESFADRLLAYKHKSLNIVNIASPNPVDWFREANYDFMGVSSPAAVTKTEYGIVWVNRYGCFFYDGKRILNLIESKIKEDDKSSDPPSWDDFINAGSMIGFQPKSKQLIVVNESGATVGDIYLYDFKTKSWVFGSSIFSSTIKTNFAVDHNGDLIISEESSANAVVKYWDNDGASHSANSIKIQPGGDIDFEYTGLVKKVYGAIITYKCTATQTNPLKYAIDGGTSFSNNFTCTFSNTSGAWAKTQATVTAFECQSLAIYLTNPTNTDKYDINDITIIYRILPSKRVS